MRRSWNGVLRIGRVSIPLGIAPAIQENNIEFSFMCPDHDVGMDQVIKCKVDGQEWAQADVDRGYPQGAQAMVRIKKEELEALPREVDQVITITETHPMDTFNWDMIKQPYLTETDPATGMVYASLIQALSRTALVACGKITARGRVHPVALIAPNDHELRLYTLYWPEEVMAGEPCAADHNAVAVTGFVNDLTRMEVDDGVVLEGLENTYLQALQELVNVKLAPPPVRRRRVTARRGRVARARQG